jgi:hypothetical protein
VPIRTHFAVDQRVDRMVFSGPMMSLACDLGKTTGLISVLFYSFVLLLLSIAVVYGSAGGVGGIYFPLIIALHNIFNKTLPQLNHIQDKYIYYLTIR